jgi:acyl carrier protein
LFALVTAATDMLTVGRSNAMGLDAVELVMEVEDAFDVQISDERAVEIRTVGDLYNVILESKRGNVAPRDICLSAATFFMVRRGLSAEFDVDPKSVRPRTSVDATLPEIGRRSHWTALRHRLNLKLPSLVRPRWLVISLTTVVIVASILGGLFAFQVWGTNVGAIVGLASLLVCGVLAAQLTEPFARYPGQTFADFRGLSHVVLARNYATLSRKFDSWNPTDVWDALRIIIVEQLGVKPELVTKDALFVSDLGMD